MIPDDIDLEEDPEVIELEEDILDRYIALTYTRAAGKQKGQTPECSKPALRHPTISKRQVTGSAPKVRFATISRPKTLAKPTTPAPV
jgi:hypothetical protein